MKNYVEVTAVFDKEGVITPIAVKIDDEKFEVDRVMDIRPAAFSLFSLFDKNGSPIGIKESSPFPKPFPKLAFFTAIIHPSSLTTIQILHPY